jgi:hypothetical protein
VTQHHPHDEVGDLFEHFDLENTVVGNCMVESEDIEADEITKFRSLLEFVGVTRILMDLLYMEHKQEVHFV